MDTILNEMGTKWQTLSKDQQVALAQTVAGVRQYTHLVSLMENWDKFQTNLVTAQSASGTLASQSAIYEQSWEAASKRVKASLEDIYDSILNDEFIIKLTNGFSKFLDIIADTVDAMGGMRGVLSMIGALVTKIFGREIADALSSLTYNSKKAIQDAEQIKTKTLETLKNSQIYDTSTDSGSMRFAAYEGQANLQSKILLKKQELLKAGKQITQEEENLLNIFTQQANALGESAIQAAQRKENLQKSLDSDFSSFQRRTMDREGYHAEYIHQPTEQAMSQAKAYGFVQTAVDNLRDSINNVQTPSGMEQIVQTIEKIKKAAEEGKIDISEFDAALDALSNAASPEVARAAFEDLITVVENTSQNVDTAFQEIRENLASIPGLDPRILEQFDSLREKATQVGSATFEASNSANKFKSSLEGMEGSVRKVSGAAWTAADGLMAFGNILSSITMSINSLVGLIDVWNNKDMSFGRKLLSTFTSLSMVIPMVVSAFKKANVLKMGEGLFKVNQKSTINSFSDLKNYAKEKAEARRIEKERRNAALQRIKEVRAAEVAANAESQMEAIKAEEQEKIAAIQAEYGEMQAALKGESEEVKAALAQEEQEKIAAIQAETAEKIAAVQSETAEQVAAIQGEKNERVAAALGENSEQIIAIYGEVAEQAKAIEGEVAEQQAAIASELAESVAAVQSEYAENIAATQAETQEALLAIAGENEEAAASIAAEGAEKVAALEQEMTEKIAAMEQEAADAALGIAGEGAEKIAALEQEAAEAAAAIAGEAAEAAAGVAGEAVEGAAGAAKKAGGVFSGAAKGIGSYAASLGKMAAVAAAVAIVIGTVSLAISQFNEDANNAQNAAEMAGVLATEFQNVKSSYENFASSIQSYKDLEGSLDGLTKGTLEYQEALFNANNEALNLINTHSELAGQYTMENGVIKFNDGALEEVQQAELERMNQMQSTQLTNSIATSKLQSKVKKTDITRDMSTLYDVDTHATNAGAAAIAGAGAGALIGTVIPGIGNAIGAGIGAAIGGAVGLISGAIASIASGNEDEKESAAIDTIVAAVQKDSSLLEKFADGNEQALREFLETDLKIDPKLINALIANKDAILAYTEQEIGKEKQRKSQEEMAFATYNTNDSIYKNAENQEYLNIKGQQRMEENDEQITSEVQDLWSGSNDDFWAQYLEYVMQDTNIDEDSTTGDNYRITDLGGGAVTIQKKNAETGAWENVTEEDALDEDVAEQQLIEAKKVAEASDSVQMALDAAEYASKAKDLREAGIGEDNVDNIINTKAREPEAAAAKLTAFDYFNLDSSKINDTDLKNYVDAGKKEFEKNKPDWLTQEYWDSLTFQDQNALGNLQLDKNSLQEDVENAIDMAQDYASNNKIIASIELKDDIQNAFESGNETALREAFAKFIENNDTYGEEDFNKFVMDLFEGKNIYGDVTDGSSFLQAMGSYQEGVSKAQTDYDNAVEKQEAQVEEAGKLEDHVFGTNDFSYDGLSFDTNAMDAKIVTQDTWNDFINKYWDNESGNWTNPAMGRVLKQYADSIGMTAQYEHLMDVQRNYGGATFEEAKWIFGAHATDYNQVGNGFLEYVQENPFTYTTRDGVGIVQKTTAEGIRADAADSSEVTDAEAELTKAQEGFSDVVLQGQYYLNYAKTNYGEDAAVEIAAYEKALKNKNLTEEEAIKVASKLQQRIKEIDTKKACKQLKDLGKELSGLTGTDRQQKFQQMADVLNETFNIDAFDYSNVEEAYEEIQNFTNGKGLGEKTLTIIMDAKYGSEVAKGAWEQLSDEEKNQIAVTLGVNIEEAKKQYNEFYNWMMSQGGRQFVIEAIVTGNTQDIATKLFELGMSIEQIDMALSSLGLSFNVEGLKEAKRLYEIWQTDGNGIEGHATHLDYLDALARVNISSTNYTGGTIQDPGGGGGGGGSEDKGTVGDQLKEKRESALERERSRLQKKREGLDPEAASKYYKEEIELLEEENELLEEQLDLKKELLKEAVAEFQKEHPELKIELDDNGEIANLSKLYAEMQIAYDKMVLEEGQDAAEEYYGDVLDDLENLIGINDDVADINDKIKDNEKEQAELALKDITERIDWRIKQIDYQIERLNYYQEKLLKQAHGNKQTIEAMLEGFQYQEQEMLQLFEKGETLRQGIDELNAAKAQYPDYAQMFDEQILEYQSDLIDVNMDIIELRNNIEELVKNVLAAARDEIDIQIGRLDTYSSMLSNLNNIIDLSGRAMLDAGTKARIGALRVETLTGKMTALKKQMDGLIEAEKLAEKALEARRADNDTSSVKFWENQVEELKREMEAASNTFLESWAEVLEAAGELFDLRVEMAVNTLSNALSPFENLETLQDSFEKAKTIQEQYLDDATKLYELNKLNRQLNLAINDENDLLAKSKLRDIQAQIYEYQKSGVEMSQYDLDILQKRYDIQLAEIALMEAQNSKSRMRLVRDAGGNWTYAYDADEQAIEDATQVYEDAVQELHELSRDYLNDTSEQLIENQIEFKDALMDLDKNSADYLDQLLALQEYYTERQRYLLSELNKGVVESGITFHDTLYGQMTDLYDYQDAYNQFITNSDTTINDLKTNYKDWQSVVEQAMNVAGTSWEDFGTDTDGTLTSLEDHIQALCDEISELVDVLMAYVAQAIGMVEEWQAKYSKQVDEEIAKNEAYIDGNFSSSGGGSMKMGGISDYSHAIDQIYANGSYTENGVTYTSKDIGQLASDREAKLAGMAADGSSTDQTASDKGWRTTDDVVNNNPNDKNKKPASGATGMYTGDWPVSEGMDALGGKLAILHQKELVLNKQDTQNILDAVKISRGQQMSNYIDKQVAAMLSMTNMTLSELTRQVQLKEVEQQPIQQQVEITAEFPNAVDQYEIREALSNLSNDASQYLNLYKNF